MVLKVLQSELIEPYCYFCTHYSLDWHSLFLYVLLGSNPLHVPNDPDTMSTQSFAELSSISLEKYDILVVKQHFAKVR